MPNPAQEDTNCAQSSPEGHKNVPNPPQKDTESAQFTPEGHRVCPIQPIKSNSTLRCGLQNKHQRSQTRSNRDTCHSESYPPGKSQGSSTKYLAHQLAGAPHQTSQTLPPTSDTWGPTQATNYAQSSPGPRRTQTVPNPAQEDTKCAQSTPEGHKNVPNPPQKDTESAQSTPEGHRVCPVQPS